MADSVSQRAPSRPASSGIAGKLKTPSQTPPPAVVEEDKDKSASGRVDPVTTSKFTPTGSGKTVMSAKAGREKLARTLGVVHPQVPLVSESRKSASTNSPPASSLQMLAEGGGFAPITPRSFPSTVKSRPPSFPSNSEKRKSARPAPRDVSPDLDEEDRQRNNSKPTSSIAASPSTKSGPTISPPRDTQNRQATIPPQNLYNSVPKSTRLAVQRSGLSEGLPVWSQNLAKHSAASQPQESTKRRPETASIQSSRANPQEKSTVARLEGRKDSSAQPIVSRTSPSLSLATTTQKSKRADTSISKVTKQQIPTSRSPPVINTATILARSTTNMGPPIIPAKAAVAYNSPYSNTVTNKDKASGKATNLKPGQNNEHFSPAKRMPENPQPGKESAVPVTNKARSAVTSPQSPNKKTPVGLGPEITFGVNENSSAPSAGQTPMTTSQTQKGFSNAKSATQLMLLKMLFELTKPELKQQVLALAEELIKSPEGAKPVEVNKSKGENENPTNQVARQSDLIEASSAILATKPKETQVLEDGVHTLSGLLSPRSQLLANMEEMERIETAKLLEKQRMDKQHPLKRSRYVFEQDQDDEAQTWEIDEVLEKRTRHEYLVSYKGKRLEEQEWVTADSFTHSTQARAVLESRARAAFGDSAICGTIVVAPPSHVAIPKGVHKEKSVTPPVALPEISSPRSSIPSTPSPPRSKRRGRPSKDKTPTPKNGNHCPAKAAAVTKRPRGRPPKDPNAQKAPFVAAERPVIQISTSSSTTK